MGKLSLNAAQPYAKAEGRVFLLVPAYPGCPGTKAVKRLLLLYIRRFVCIGACMYVHIYVCMLAYNSGTGRAISSIFSG